MNKLGYLSVLAGSIFFLAITYRCASVGSITGGVKDSVPPNLVNSDPPMYAKNFKKNRIDLEFDEYIEELRDVNKEFNISPPLNKRPKIWLKNKTVVIQYTDTLRDSTTYTLNFGNSIKDKNEGNTVTNFEFVFSTTSYLDSLSVKGRIINSFDLKPQDGTMLAILHVNFSDSAVFKEVPMFTSRADKDGYFSINNVKPGKYNLFALQDRNFNYKYNQGSDAIAFVDSIIVLDAVSVAKKREFIFPPDTAKIKHDTAHIEAMLDNSIIQKNRNSLLVDLFFFSEKEKRQYIKNYFRKNKYFFNLVFSNELQDDSLLIKPVNFKSENWYKLERTYRRDSMIFWLTDTNLIKTDTFKIAAQYWGTNKFGKTVWKTDTLNFRFLSETRTSKKVQAKVAEMKITTDAANTIDLNFTPSINTEFPISKLDKSKFKLTQKVDSVEFPSKFEITEDSVVLTKVMLNSKWIEQTEYTLTIFPGAFESIYGIGHDTIISKFATQKYDYYGKLTVNVAGVKTNVILQLLDKETVEYEKTINRNGEVIFDYLYPKEYIIKIIYDNNKDGKWTTGDLVKKIQPEKVYFFKDNVNVRSNWEMDLKLNIE